MDAKRYNNIKLGVGISKTLLSFILISLFVLLGYSLLLENYISSYYENKYLIFLAFVLVTGVAASFLFAPVNYYTGFYLEHEYNLSNQTFGKWIWENFKSRLVSLVIGVPIMLMFYFTLNQFGEMWWLPFAILMFFYFSSFITDFSCINTAHLLQVNSFRK